MARKSKKQKGALVSLPARKNSGLGMIMEIRNQKEAKLIYEVARRTHRDRKEPSEIDKRLSAAFGYYSRDGKGELYSQRKYAYVQWIKKPSDWNQTAINHKADWYPLSILRVISEVVKS
jgi:hypothetical protein